MRCRGKWLGRIALWWQLPRSAPVWATLGPKCREKGKGPNDLNFCLS